MREKRLLYYLLGLVTVVSLGVVKNQLVPAPSSLVLRDDGIRFPDGSVQTTAAATELRLAFYLTKTWQTGATADQACAYGFHFASLWEILDVSHHRYDRIRGVTRADSGSGPPSLGGWIRTGSGLGTSSLAGQANCANLSTNRAWDSDLEEDFGTTATLANVWSSGGGESQKLDPWVIQTTQCSNWEVPSWCVEDYPGAGDIIPLPL